MFREVTEDLELMSRMLSRGLRDGDNGWWGYESVGEEEEEEDSLTARQAEYLWGSRGPSIWVLPSVSFVGHPTTPLPCFLLIESFPFGYRLEHDVHNAKGNNIPQ